MAKQTGTTGAGCKARALLVFLAVEAAPPHARETVASMFWPDCPDAVALTYLRSVLANLRQLVGDQGAEPTGAPLPDTGNPTAILSGRAQGDPTKPGG